MPFFLLLTLLPPSSSSRPATFLCPSQGLAKAMFNLGLMYEKRRGVSQEAPEADLLEATRECYGAAAEAGVTKAMVRICPDAVFAFLRPCLLLPPPLAVSLFQRIDTPPALPASQPCYLHRRICFSDF